MDRKKSVKTIVQSIAKRFLLGLSLSILTATAVAGDFQGPGEPSDLPLPSSMTLVEYERVLYKWILDREYTKRGWSKDKEVRDTGPYLDQVYYGTHPAVRIYYSPEVMTWLLKGRPSNEPIPDGAMIIKEMFTPPAVIYQELADDPEYVDPEDYEKLISGMVNNWTIMIKDSKGSSDGWFWGSVGLPSGKTTIRESIAGQIDTPKNRKHDFLRYSGFGMPCIRCHASAESELTFSDLLNIEGQPGDPLIFKVDDSWRTPEYIASAYPLCKLKDKKFVKKHFYLPEKNSAGIVKRPPADDSIQCPPLPGKLSAEAPIVFNDHDFRDNKSFVIPAKPEKKPNALFLETFDQFPNMKRIDVAKFPAAWMDHVTMPEDHPTKYITSDNCIGCHGGLGGAPNRNVMFVPNQNGKAKDGFNISEYGEWRWSPMGVAGRDPIFHSQLESEMAYLIRDNGLTPSPLKAPLQASQDATANLCLSCHGAMGQRELQADAKVNKDLDPNFKPEYFYLEDPVTDKIYEHQMDAGALAYSKYGALAREGISCMVCHHIDAPDAEAVKNWKPKPEWLSKKATPFERELAYNLFHHSTGTYQPGPADEVFGPFDVAQLPMHNALNVTPKDNPYTSNSQMCGNCHTINLPNIGATHKESAVLNAASKTSETTAAFEKYEHSIEQATFLEWQNSVFGAVDKKGRPEKEFQSCQECHMPGGFKNETEKIDIDQVVTQIASIQDSSYSEAGHSLANEEIDIPMRDNYKRHTHVGLNVFLVSMMDQFSEILGMNTSDYMTTADTGPALALESMIQQAQEDSATVKVTNLEVSKYVADAKDKCTDPVGADVLTADVTVQNLTGHRLPSGVAFRRSFLEFTVFDGNEPIWRSGGTNELGIIIGGNKKPLETEFFKNGSYQKHHEIVDCQSQAQIYEELTKNALGEFTTSFVHRVTHIKDNRLLPKGWRESTFFKRQGQVMEQFMAATDPDGVGNDPDYRNPSNSLKFKGQDNLKYSVRLPPGTNLKNLKVKASLYSQAIPPYWLKQRFDAVKDAPAEKSKATRRLHYMVSHLDLEGTPMADWKLLLVSDTEALE